MTTYQKYQLALKDLGIKSPARFGGMYCTLDLRMRHGHFGLWEREHSGYDGASYCLIKKMNLSDAYGFSLAHPIIKFAHDDTKEQAEKEYDGKPFSPIPQSEVMSDVEKTLSERGKNYGSYLDQSCIAENLMTAPKIQGFNHDTKSDLCIQEQSDAFLLEKMKAERFPPPANIAISALRIVQAQLKRMEFLPTGHARRHIEDVASPAAARACFAAIKHLDPDTPNHVIAQGRPKIQQWLKDYRSTFPLNKDNP